MNLFLSNANFRKLWLSSTFAGASSNIVQYALSLYVLDMTQSATAFAGILSIVIFPRLFFSPFAGVWGDRTDRKRALIWTSVFDVAILLLVGAFGLWKGQLPLAAIYVLVIGMEIVEVLQSGPMSSVLPAIVEKEELGIANTWMHVDDGIVAVVTPFISALIYSQFSIMGSLLIGGVILFLTTIGYMLMQLPDRKEAVVEHEPGHLVKNFVDDFMEGIRAGIEIPNVLPLAFAALLVNFLLSPTFGVVMTTFMRVTLGTTNTEFSFIESMSAVVGIGAPIVAMKFMSDVKNPVKLLLSNLLGMVAGLAVVFVATILVDLKALDHLPSIALIMVGFAIVQIVVTYVNIGISTLFGQIVPEKYMGRIGSTLGVLGTISVPMGQLVFGYLMEWTNATVCLGVSMLGLIAFLLFSGKSMQEEAVTVEG